MSMTGCLREDGGDDARMTRGELAVITVVALAGLAVSAYLAVHHEGFGCGISDDCGVLAATRWATWFGWPVAWLGVGVYVSVLLAVASLGMPGGHRPLAQRLLEVMAVVVAAAAAWFTWLQGQVIGRWCSGCILVHLCGLLLAALVLRRHRACRGTPGGGWGGRLLLGLCCLAVLITGQRAGAGPRHRITAIERLEVDVPAVTVDRAVRLPGSGLVVSTRDAPLLGSPAAKDVAVLWFDYTCGLCRHHAADTHAQVATDSDLAIILLPVPMHPDCNAVMPAAEPGKPAACELARLALVVWRYAPEHFAEFHMQLMSCPPALLQRHPAYPCMPAPSAAHLWAAQWLGRRQLEYALADPHLDEQLRAYANAWWALPDSTKKVPVLLLGTHLLEGAMDPEVLGAFVAQNRASQP